MPLTMADTGKPLMIKKVGGNPETRKFLENLGFVAGGSVTIINEIRPKIISETINDIAKFFIPFIVTSVLFLLYNI